MMPMTPHSRAGTLLGAAVALALGACSSSSSPLPDSGPATSTCSSDAECQTGFLCDVATRQCYCTGDAACPQGLFCNAFTGLCVSSVPGCTSNNACDAGQYCDDALRTCAAITPSCGKCHNDAECGANSFCAANPTYPSAGTFCSPACVTGSDGAAGCPDGLLCEARDATVNAQMLCFPASGACGVSNACVPDSLALCTTTADCNDATQVCDTTAGDCVAANRVCPAGDSCDPQQRVCGHACATDADCTQIEGAPGFECRNNACYAVQSCSNDSDCAVHQICAPNPEGTSSCTAGCVLPTDCPIGQGCNNDPSHPRCTTGCQANSDCPLNQICSNGACVGSISGCAQTCQATAVCPLAATCSANQCCVAASLAQICTNDKCTGNTSTGCLELFGHVCTSLADCSDLPNTSCVPISGGTYCGGTLQLQNCTSASDCPYKGFTCTSFGGTSLFCTPTGAAIDSCFAGH